MGTGIIPAPPKAPDGFRAIDDPNDTPSPVSPGGSAPDSQGFQTAPTPAPTPPPRGTVPPSEGSSARPATPPPRGTTEPTVPDTPPADTTPSAPGQATPEAPSDAPSDSKKPPEAKEPKAPDKQEQPSLSDSKKAEDQVVELVNKERAKAGCDPLKSDQGLAKLARSFSVDMGLRGFFAHVDPDGNDPWDRAAAAGVGNLGAENIARGQAEAEAVMAAWMASPGHRANILNCDFKTIGIGVYFGPEGPWWTQNFGQ